MGDKLEDRNILNKSIVINSADPYFNIYIKKDMRLLVRLSNRPWKNIDRGNSSAMISYIVTF
jgi:hypothetical protein